VPQNLHSVRRSRLLRAQHGLGRRQARDGHAEWGAGDVVQADLGAGGAQEEGGVVEAFKPASVMGRMALPGDARPVVR
jgi:hypothetical protein